MRVKRHEVPDEKTWQLKDIFADEQELLEVAHETERRINQWLMQSLLLVTPRDLYAMLETYEHFAVAYDQVSSYLMYLYSEDSGDTHTHELMSQTQSLGTAMRQVHVKVRRKVQELEQSLLASWLEQDEHLYLFAPYLEKVMDAKKGMLPESEEELLRTLSGTLQTPYNLFQAITTSDLQFDSAQSSEGERLPLSLHMYMTQVETSPDTQLRHSAYASLGRGLRQHQHASGTALAAEIQKNVQLAKLKGYDSAIEMLLSDRTPFEGFFVADPMTVEQFELILDTFRTGLSKPMQQYARLRKETLGLEELLFSDVKAPLRPDFNPKITFEEAGKILVGAAASFGEEFQEAMRQAVEERWVYQANNEGCRMIPFGSGTHGVHGYSFYPWGGSLFDVLLLGHELGHAIHFHFSGHHQKIINNSQSILFVESPSTLVEHVTVEYMRQQTDDPHMIEWLDMYLLMSYHHNCVTHVLEAELLRRLYGAAEKGHYLSVSFISQTKQTILKEFWGDTVLIDETAALTWMRQPHYYMGLYPFTYSVGMAASRSIASRLATDGVAYGKRWTEQLKAGGTKNGHQLFEEMDVDVLCPTSFQSAIRDVQELVNRVEHSIRF